MRFRQLFGAFALLVLVSILGTSVAYAATWEYRFPITVSDNSGVARVYLPVRLGFGAQGLVTGGKIDSDGLDTNMQIGSSDMEYMLTTTNVTAIIDSLPAYGKTELNLYTGYSPDQSGFPMVFGYGGNASISDVAPLEFGGYFESEMEAYIDTTAVNGTLVYKEDAYRTHISSSGSIRSSLLSAGDVEEFSVTANNVSSGNHTVRTTLYSGNTTRQLFFGGGEDGADQVQNSYAAVHGNLHASGYNWATGSNDGQIGEVMPIGGVLTNFAVRILTAPNTTKQWDFTIQVNEVDSALSVAISDNDTVSSVDTDSVRVNRGDFIMMKCDPTNTPTDMEGAYWVVTFIPDSIGEVVLFSDTGITSLDSNDIRWMPFAGNCGQYTDDSYEHAETVIPAAGTIKKFYAEVEGAAGVGDSWTFTVLKNGVSTNLTTTISGSSQTIDYNSVDSFTVAAGDTITLKSEYGSTPTAKEASFGVIYQPDTQGNWMSSVIVEGNFFPDGAIRYTTLAWAKNAFQATETDVQSYAYTTTAKALYADTEIAPDTYFTFTLRQNGADTVLSANITNPSTTGSDTDDVSLAVGDNMSIYWYIDEDDTGTDTERVSVSILYYNTPTTGNYLQLYVDGSLEDSIYCTSNVTDNANDWYIGSEATPAINYYQHTVGIGLNLIGWYQPNTMLTDSTIPDRQGGDEPATINWGTNSGLNIIYGAMVAYDATEATTDEVGGFDMPTAVLPSTWFASGENLASLPFYDSFSEVSAQTGRPVQTIYFMGIIGIAFGVFLLLVTFARSALFGVIGFNIVLFIGSSMTIVPMWIPFVCLVTMFGIMFLYKQVAY